MCRCVGCVKCAPTHRGTSRREPPAVAEGSVRPHGCDCRRGEEAKMTDATRETIWSILGDAFGAVLHSLQATMPEVRMAAGHSHNEAFPFRAYAEYSIGERVVDLSFDVQVKDSRIHAFGDIAFEN